MRQQETIFDDVNDFLQKAGEAAEQGNANDMLIYLTASPLLDGLMRILRSQWGRNLPEHVLEECIAYSVDAAYNAVREGRTIASLAAWMKTVARNRAADAWQGDYSLRYALEEDTLENIPNEQGRPEGNVTTCDITDDDQIRKHTVRTLRSLLPHIGQGQVVEVLEVYLDAVESDLQDITSTQIGEMLGLSPNSVRTLFLRGCTRLRGELEKRHIKTRTDFLSHEFVQNEEENEDE